MEPGPLGQPVPDHRCLVSAVVIEDEMNVQIDRDLCLDNIQKLAELNRTMPLVELADDTAGLQVQSSKQGRGPVAFIVVGAALHLTWLHGKQRLRPVKRLNLAFFINAKDQGVI